MYTNSGPTRRRLLAFDPQEAETKYNDSGVDGGERADLWGPDPRHRAHPQNNVTTMGAAVQRLQLRARKRVDR